MSLAGFLVLIPSILILSHFQIIYYLVCDYALCSASEYKNILFYFPSMLLVIRTQ
jgi:hypothetical protein